MITDKEINSNKEEFLNLLSSINIEGANIEGLTDWLTKKSDFFIAPASTKYHCSFKGGLCQHSLNVYHNACNLNTSLGLNIPEDSIKVITLLHDISKANLYELYFRNVKNEVTGQWEQVPEYKIKSENARFIYGNHEQNSEFMVRTFIPLSVEESSAILHHHAGMSWDSAKEDCAPIFNRFTMASLLHTADFLATFINERETNE